MSTTLERLQYGFDRDSRRTWRKRTLTTGEDNAYGYDGLSQVVNAARGNLNFNATAIGGVPAEVQAWDYDPTGNWRGYETQANGSVALDQTRVHDKGNRLTQIVDAPNPVLLDRAGRMREVSPDAGGNWNQAQQVTWDAWSRVTEVRRKSDGAVLGSYSYDGLTRRTTQSVGVTTTHIYYSDAWRPLEERFNSQTTAARQYYWGARHRDDLVRRDRATTSGGPLNETRYVLMDYFSPAALTDATGTIKERYAFSAFGVRRILTPAFGDRATSECDFTFAFQGQFLDAESGFLNYGYRYYSPNLGRWLSKDPIGEVGGVNLYAYLATPNVYDLLGLAPEGNQPLDEIGKAAAKEALEESRKSHKDKRQQIEYCGCICECPKTGERKKTGPVSGGIGVCYPQTSAPCSGLGKCWKLVGTYHSHPAGPTAPSGQDRKTSRDSGTPGFIAEDMGSAGNMRVIKHQDYKDGRPSMNEEIERIPK